MTVIRLLQGAQVGSTTGNADFTRLFRNFLTQTVSMLLLHAEREF